MLHSGAIPESQQNVAIISRLCDVVKFPHAQAFLGAIEPPNEVARLRALVARLEGATTKLQNASSERAQ